MTNNESVEDGTEGGYTAQSPEQFEQWFNGLTTEEQKAWMERINRLSESRPLDPSNFPTGYIEALTEKYGHVPELNNTVAVEDDEFTQKDTDRLLIMQIISDNTDIPFRNAMQLAELIVDGLEEEHRPDEELDDFEYYGRHGYSRTAPTCTEPDCPCED